MTIEKDICIVVNGQYTYKLSSACLRYASTFFDNMLSHPMRESTEKRVAFPTKTKAEWELIHPYLDLRVARKARVTYDDAKILLQWDEELMMKSGSLKKMCDTVVFNHLEDLRKSNYMGRWDKAYCPLAVKIVDVMKIAFRYDLQESKPAPIIALCQCMGTKGAMTLLYGMRPVLGDETLWEALCNDDVKRESELTLVGPMDFDAIMKSLHGDEWTPIAKSAVNEKETDEAQRDGVAELTEIEEDVTVMVGDDFECKLSSDCLRYASSHFDKMLSNLTEEEIRKKKIEFPTKTKAEWDLIHPYLDLRVAQKPSVSCGDAKILLQWNEELGIKNESLKPMCDSIVCQFLNDIVMENGRAYHEFVECLQIDKDILNMMKVSFRYDLPKSKPVAITTLSRCTGPEVAMSIVYGMSPILGDSLLWETLCKMDSKITGDSSIAGKENMDFDGLIKSLHE